MKNVITFAHIAISGNRTPFTSCVTDSSSRKADQTNAVLQLSLTLKFQKSYVVVQGLAVVIVMNVSRGNSQGLSSRTSILASKVVVAYPHVNCVT